MLEVGQRVVVSRKGHIGFPLEVIIQKHDMKVLLVSGEVLRVVATHPPDQQSEISGWETVDIESTSGKVFEKVPVCIVQEYNEFIAENRMTERDRVEAQKKAEQWFLDNYLAIGMKVWIKDCYDLDQYEFREGIYIMENGLLYVPNPHPFPGSGPFKIVDDGEENESYYLEGYDTPIPRDVLSKKPPKY